MFFTAITKSKVWLKKIQQPEKLTFKNIIMYEYLPSLLGFNLPAYTGYNPDLHPGISHIFQSAAFRFGHTMIPPGIYRRDEHCNFRTTKTGQPAIRLCTTWWDSNEILINNTLEELVMGLTSQVAEREDSLLTSDIRDSLFGPREHSLRDLGALNIMRGRDNGLLDYNAFRKHLGLAPRRYWNEINPELFNRNPELLRSLMEIYANNLSNVDVYLGGMLESTSGPGELFSTIIQDQFLRLRDADRFWFENEINGIFIKSEIEDIRSVTMWDIITNTTNTPPDAVQRNVFVWLKDDPCPQPYQLNSSMLEPCMTLQRYNYFKTDALPTVLLGLRIAYKEGSKTSPAEMVYRTSLQILGDFFFTTTSLANNLIAIKSLRQLFKSFRHIPV
ncbi:dual oxidase-like [Copidosoma floridanum]|uniref:dual oxidase-like n=1 Tax=Copidosoma floridanum TaxID=29053 RepID=UPI0006C9404B|nr:dual oxidase-like [Copidosoma floridanum]